MIDRRSLVALGMFAPVAGKSLRLDLPDPRIHPLNTGGVRVIGISPNTTRLIGTRDSETICILDAETPWTLAESDPFPELPLLDERAIRWSPDGSKIAFGLHPWTALRDADIYVMDVETGAIDNLTPEGTGNEATDLLASDADGVNVDTSPAWLDDATLVFARHPFTAGDDFAVELVKLNINDGSVETWADLTAAGVRFVLSPLWQRSDGSLVFEVDLLVDGRQSRQAMIVDPDGTTRTVETHDRQYIYVIDVNDSHLLAQDPEAFDHLYVSLEGESDSQDLWERFPLPEGHTFRSAPTLGPEPDSILLLTENEKNQVFLLQIDDSGSTQIAELNRDPKLSTVTWEGNVVLVVGEDRTWKIELEN